MLFLRKNIKSDTMKTDSGKKTEAGRGSLTMRSIFRCMMEEGYYPEYEKTHILFGMDSDTAVVEYEEGMHRTNREGSEGTTGRGVIPLRYLTLYQVISV